MIEGLISILIQASKGLDRLNEALGKLTDRLIQYSERGGPGVLSRGGVENGEL